MKQGFHIHRLAARPICVPSADAHRQQAPMRHSWHGKVRTGAIHQFHNEYGRFQIEMHANRRLLMYAAEASQILDS